MIKTKLLILLLAISVGGWECSLTGSSAFGSTAFGQNGDNASAAVVGIDWPEGGAYGTLEILYEAEKETTFADNDPVETPTHFGALTIAATQGTLGSRLAYQSPCDVGPSLACYYADGGDRWYDSTVRATLNFLHNGAGASCYIVVEPSSSAAANSKWMATGARVGTDIGFAWRFTSSTTDRLQCQVANGAGYPVGGAPSGGTGLDTATWGAGCVHATSRSPDYLSFWEGATVGGTAEANYAAAVSASNAASGLAIASSGPGAIEFTTGHLFAIACYSATHTATETTGVWAAVEAVMGALPQ